MERTDRLVEALRRLNVPEQDIDATLRAELGLSEEEAAAALARHDEEPAGRDEGEGESLKTVGSYTGPLEILDAHGTLVAKVLGRLTKRQWQRSGRTDWSGIVYGSGVDFLEVLGCGDELAVRVGGRVGTAFVTRIDLAKPGTARVQGTDEPPF